MLVDRAPNCHARRNRRQRIDYPAGWQQGTLRVHTGGGAELWHTSLGIGSPTESSSTPIRRTLPLRRRTSARSFSASSPNSDALRQHGGVLQGRPWEKSRWAGCLAYRTKRTVFGQERTVVVTYNEHLLEGQMQGINANLHKARRKLHELQHSLRRRQAGKTRGGKKPTVQTVTRAVEQILGGQFLKKLLRCQVKPGAVPALSFRTDTGALARLTRTQLGKTILFTDNQDWSEEEIVLGYRAQHHIESAFRDMKNPHFLGWSPMFHWTDSKIRVHAFYCVLALTLTSLLQRALHQKGHDLSVARMLELLGGIKEILLVYPKAVGEKKPRTAACLSTMEEEQRQLFDQLNLSRYQRV